MRKAMNESFLKEQKSQELSERKTYGNKLTEKWIKKSGVGDGIKDIASENPDKARNLAIMLENEERHLQSLTETQISSNFSTTPENVLRVVRLGYPNSVRGEIFFEYPMVTARDSIYYLSPIYESTSRGATADNVTHESSSYRYATEIVEDIIDVADGSTTSFTGFDSDDGVTEVPIRPYTFIVFVADTPVARDDGSGAVTPIVTDFLSTSTINYTTGAYSIVFATAPVDGSEIKFQYHFDSEDSDRRSDIKSVKLQLTDYQLRAKPYPLYVSWSKMSELLLGSTLNIDAEENLIAGAADELKKSLDFLAVEMGYRYSKRNSSVTFNTDFAAAGSDSEVAHAQSLTRRIKEVENIIYAVNQRGGVSAIVAAPDVIAYMTLHNQYNGNGGQPKIGIYRVGEIMGIPLYQAPTDIVTAGSALCVWRNPNADGGDYSLVFGSLIPLYQTQTLEYKEGYSETGLFHFGDWIDIQRGYLVRLLLTNL